MKSDKLRDERFLERAIELSKLGMNSSQGGPFGCIVVKGDEIIGEGSNQVTSSNDPTAHAEVIAIREACKVLGTFQLTNCEIYTSCEPCPMCLGAIYWARPSRVYYANTKEDAASIAFDASSGEASRGLPDWFVQHSRIRRLQLPRLFAASSG